MFDTHRSGQAGLRQVEYCGTASNVGFGILIAV